MEIAWVASGGTRSHSKLALEYFELAVMKAKRQSDVFRLGKPQQRLVIAAVITHR